MRSPSVSFSSSGISRNPKCVVRALLDEASGLVELEGDEVEDDAYRAAALGAGEALALLRPRAVCSSTLRPDMVAQSVPISKMRESR